VIDRWSGQIMETTDGLAFIGRVERGREVFVATGDCGNGMTHGTIAGMLLSDLIAGRPSSWAEVYDPARLRLRSLGRFALENANVAAQYTDWLSRKASVPVEDIPLATGAVVRRGLAPIAMYRDPEGQLHECSAVCPHLGCIVAWNATERTWDCPCHGSRFAATGEVLHGPATQGLRGVTDGDGANPDGRSASGEDSDEHPPSERTDRSDHPPQ
jgi:nitrite reductase/ring-hydroxylating ferredoxin subunit